MNEAAGFGHAEKLTPAQLRRVQTDTVPGWVPVCRDTRTDTEGSKA
jgi:hypothetical protein